MGFDVSEINDLKEFMDIEKEWNLLLSESCCDIPFMRHEWLRLWWEHFGDKNIMAVIIIRKSQKLIFAIPLMERRRFFGGIPFITMESMTNLHSYRYHFLLRCGEEKAFHAFWQYLQNRPRRWHILQLCEMPLDNPVYKSFVEASHANNYRIKVAYSYDSPYLPIHGNWVDYFGSLKRKFQSNMRNRAKRLNSLGKVDYEVMCDLQEVDSALATGFTIEQKSWKGVSGTAIACNPELISFYTRWAQIAAKQKWLQLSFLKVNGQPVAFDYSLKYQDRMYCMKIGYDPDFYKFSVGQLLCAEILKRCFKNGVAEYDFLGETTEQKRNWTTHFRKNLWLNVYNCRWKSRLHYSYKFLFKKNLKELFHNETE